MSILSLYFLTSSSPNKGDAFGREVFVCINPLALLALPLYFATQNTGGEGEMYIPFSLPVSHCITGCFNSHYRRYFKTPPLCFAQQNIGEVSARTEGLTPTAKKTYEIFPIPLLKTTVPSVSPLLLPQHRGCNPSHSLKFRPTPSDFLPNRYYDLRIEFSSITMRRALYKAPIAFLKLFLLHWK